MADDTLAAELATDGGGSDLDMSQFDFSGGDYAPDPEPADDEPVPEPLDVQATDESNVATDEATDAEPTPDVVSRDDFKALQSNYEKKIAAQNAELESLRQAATQTPSGPSPDEILAYNQVKTEYEQYANLAETGETEEERKYYAFELGRVRDRFIKQESVIVAREIGIDPSDPEYTKLVQNENPDNRGDLVRMAWQAKANQNPGYAKAEVLDQREKDLEKREESAEEMVRRILREEKLISRQNSGANNVPGVQPGGAPANQAAILKKYAQLKASGDVDAVLALAAKNPWLTQ